MRKRRSESDIIGEPEVKRKKYFAEIGFMRNGQEMTKHIPLLENTTLLVRPRINKFTMRTRQILAVAAPY